MVWLLIVPLIVVWAIIQASIAESSGHAPRSRGSFRYQRHKARKLGVDAEEVPINPRLTPMTDYQEIKQKVDRFAYKWLAIPTVVFWVWCLEPWKWWH